MDVVEQSRSEVMCGCVGSWWSCRGGEKEEKRSLVWVAAVWCDAARPVWDQEEEGERWMETVFNGGDDGAAKSGQSGWCKWDKTKHRRGAELRQFASAKDNNNSSKTTTNNHQQLIRERRTVAAEREPLVAARDKGRQQHSSDDDDDTSLAVAARTEERDASRETRNSVEQQRQDNASPTRKQSNFGEEESRERERDIGVLGNLGLLFHERKEIRKKKKKKKDLLALDCKDLLNHELNNSSFGISSGVSRGKHEEREHGGAVSLAPRKPRSKIIKMSEERE
ncbi:hypothetical protein BVRB_7g164270 [Beta vulgaris subsp. vulgaris]|nr:hypothetical protein BVRB_7g164270 [Beta vulgaris subsp. vulgaris]